MFSFYMSVFVCPVLCVWFCMSYFVCPVLYVWILYVSFCKSNFVIPVFICPVLYVRFLYVQFLYVQFCYSSFWCVHFVSPILYIQFCMSGFVYSVLYVQVRVLYVLVLYVMVLYFQFLHVQFLYVWFCMFFCLSGFCMFGFVSPILYQKLLWKFYQDPTCFGCFREDLEVWVEVFDSAFSRPMIGQLSPFFVSHWWRDQNWTALGLGGGVGWEGHTNNLSQNESNIKQPTQPN